MSASVLSFPAERLSATSLRARAPELGNGDVARAMQFWRGASSRVYVHTIYNLVDCPPLPPANYILARRSEQGRPVVLCIGRVGHAAPSANLAELRYRGAHLEATEVHIHLLAREDMEAVVIELDLRAADAVKAQLQD